uniref:SNF1-related protein kinase regulatory subunit gamma-1 n=1 Tax=Anthurium amnicola TaxID=1678845 RepID=A0A1D1XEL3_9ARAE
MESPPGSARSASPEAEIGHKVEDLWNDAQVEPLLSPSEKLNSCFESVPVSSFPPAPSSQVIEIASDASLAMAVEILSKHKILSAPVRNVNAPEDASWIDRYIGIVEFAGIAVWLLHQSEVAALGIMNGSAGTGQAAGRLAAALGSVTLGTPTSKTSSIALATVAAGGVRTALGPLHYGPEAAASMGGSFFENLASSEIYKTTKVEDISGSFRWAPFLALQKSDSLLTMLLLLSKYRMKSLPVVDLGEGKIDNIITQSSVVHMLAECVGLHWFENWGTKKLFELGLPIMKPSKLVKVSEEEPVLTAFQLMRAKGVGGLPVVEEGGKKAVGNISIRDVQYLLTAPEIYKDYRSITAKNFLSAVRKYLEEHQETSPMLLGVITCKRDDTIKDVILRLDSYKIHRIYVVDEEENVEGVITLRDIISKLVHEPRRYFGDFFDGVVPLPRNSRV